MNDRAHRIGAVTLAVLDAITNTMQETGADPLEAVGAAVAAIGAVIAWKVPSALVPETIEAARNALASAALDIEALVVETKNGG